MASNFKLRKPKNPVREGKNNGSDYIFSFGPIKFGKRDPMPSVDQEFLGTYEIECIKDANSNVNSIKNQYLSKDMEFSRNCGKASENFKTSKALLEKETAEHLEVKIEFEKKKLLYENSKTQNSNIIYF